jgi:hypothetical protein
MTNSDSASSNVGNTPGVQRVLGKAIAAELRIRFRRLANLFGPVLITQPPHAPRLAVFGQDWQGPLQVARRPHGNLAHGAGKDKTSPVSKPSRKDSHSIFNACNFENYSSKEML